MVNSNQSSIQISLFLMLLLFCSLAKSLEPIEPWSSVRALGMGNAYTAVVDNSDALFYNPAGLCKVSGLNWTIADPRVGVNTPDVSKQISDFQTSSNTTQLLDGLIGKKLWLGAGAKTAITVPCLGVYAFAGADVSLQLRNPAYPTFYVNYFGDAGFGGGFAFDLFPGFMTFGTSVRKVTRTGSADPIGPSILAKLDSTAITDQFKNRGNAYAADLGVNISLPMPIRPTISAVLRNAGVTTFTKTEGTKPPPSQLDETIFGASFTIPFPGGSITPAADYKYALSKELQAGQKIHVGLELNILFVSARAGLNQGYYTLGAGLDFGVLKVDAASYAVELGRYPGQHEDRRYVVQATMELGFDPGKMGIFGSGGKGGSGGSGGSRPRLKQRR